MILRLIIFACALMSFPLIAQVGVNNPNPEQALDVNGKVKIGDDSTDPTDGTIRYNDSESSYEGYTQGSWQSFNKSGNFTGVEYLQMYAFNVAADGIWSTLGVTGENAAGGYVREDGTVTSGFPVPDDKVLLIDQIIVTARGEQPNEFFYVGIARTASIPSTSSEELPSNPRVYISGNSNSGPASIKANHIPLLRVSSGNHIIINNSSNSQAPIRVQVYGILVDDTDEFFRY